MVYISLYGWMTRVTHAWVKVRKVTPVEFHEIVTRVGGSEDLILGAIRKCSDRNGQFDFEKFLKKIPKRVDHLV